VIAPELQKAAKHCANAEELSRTAALYVSGPGDLQKAEETALWAGKESAAALALLRGLGATTPTQRAMRAASNPLAELARMENSRSEALALLDALRTAHALAEALDAKRGNVLDEPIGGSAGMVWGEDLVQLKSKLELELFGPGQSVTGARE
jgi:hypothetical protein